MTTNPCRFSPRKTSLSLPVAARSSFRVLSVLLIVVVVGCLFVVTPSRAKQTQQNSLVDDDLVEDDDDDGWPYGAERKRGPDSDLGCGRVPVYEQRLGKSFNATGSRPSENYSPKAVQRSATTNGNTTNKSPLPSLASFPYVIGEWPWVAQMVICKVPERKNCVVCTATILSDRALLTSASCLRKGYKLEWATVGLERNDKTGVVYQSFGKREYAIKRAIKHPGFKPGRNGNDLAVLITRKRIQFNPYVQPVCLLDESVKDVLEWSKGKHCWAVGYGRKNVARHSVFPRKTNIEPRSPEQCNEHQYDDRRAKRKLKLAKNTICVGPNNDEHRGGPCHQGDQGSPNQCYDPEANRWYLWGTAAYGPRTDDSCKRPEGDPWLTVASDLSKSRKWIARTLKRAKRLRA